MSAQARHLAFTTFAILKQPYGQPLADEFAADIDSVFNQAEHASGFISRATELVADEALSDFERDWGIWGKFCCPRFYTGGTTSNTDARASTLSLWESVESVMAFSYSGLHLGALRSRHRWFLKPAWPSYAMWWVNQGHVPTWSEAAESLERLHDIGPSPAAFDFKSAFDANGNRYSIAHSLVHGLRSKIEVS